MKRAYISLYYKDMCDFGKAKPYLTVVIDPETKLGKVCKRLGGSGIKRLIKCATYKLLKEKASKENRTINNFIRHVLLNKLKISNGKTNTASRTGL